MNWTIVGLGNPTEKYAKTRHNVGRDIVDDFRIENNLPDWKEKKTINALVSEGEVNNHSVTLILPETFMNDSGKSLKKLINDEKKAQQTIVVYDDLDLAIGLLKISFNKNSGGHKGIESIIQEIQTKEFVRLRVGISPKLADGEIKKVQGDKEVKDFVLTKFNPEEKEILENVRKRSLYALEIIMNEGCVEAMGKVNGN